MASAMILLCGIPSESPVAMVSQALDELGTPYVTFNQRRFAEAAMEFELTPRGITGELAIGDRIVRLEEIGGVYTRLMDDRFLPELDGLPADAPACVHCRALHEALMRWMEIADARVVNRSGPMGSNLSKPYQAQLIRRFGFGIPETLITNDPALVHEFHARHGRVIYKSISGARSIITLLTPQDFARLDLVRWCPTQFQAFVEGSDMRVHVVDTEVFATRVDSTVADYRYAGRQGGVTNLSAAELDAELRQRCVDLAHALDLPFAGIDLRITPDGEVYCFEVNPSPGFSYYQAATGQPIANAVACYLAGAQ